MHAICFTQSRINFIQIYPHRHTQNTVWPNIWAPCGPVMLIHKITHHLAGYLLLGKSVLSSVLLWNYSLTWMVTCKLLTLRCWWTSNIYNFLDLLIACPKPLSMSWATYSILLPAFSASVFMNFLLYQSTFVTKAILILNRNLADEYKHFWNVFLKKTRAMDTETSICESWISLLSLLKGRHLSSSLLAHPGQWGCLFIQ